MRCLAARRILLATALLEFALIRASGAAAQAPSAVYGSAINAPQVAVGSAMIAGTIVAADTGRPIRMARLTLNGTATVPARTGSTQVPTGAGLTRTVVSDDQGRFRFDGLPSGRFALDAVADQFLAASYGQKKQGKPGTPIDIADAQRLDVKLLMTRGGVISGSVVDEAGEPLVNARVRAMRYVPTNGFMRLRQAMQVQSDDRGLYRLFGLEPGEYLVSGISTDPADRTIVDGATTVTLSDGTAVATAARVVSPAAIDAQYAVAPSEYAPTFYPGATTAAEALKLNVDVGVERSGIDIRVLPSRTGSIQGVVTGSPGPSLVVQVLLQTADAAAEPTTMTTRASADGRFTLNGLAPGPYIVYAQTIPQDPQPVVTNGVMTVGPDAVRTTMFNRLHGRAAVVVDGPRTPPVSIALQPGRSIAGRVAFEMAQRPDPARSRTTISIAPIPQNPPLPAFNTSPQVQVDPDGTFTLPGIRPGRYVLRASGPGTLKSAMLNGQDTLDVGVEVTADSDVGEVVMTLTDRVSVLSGTLTDVGGKPGTDYTIVVAPTDARLWRQGSRRVMTTRLSTEGGYTFRGLPAGEYLVAAVTDLETGGQFDPDFLTQLVGAAVHVTISDGGVLSQNLRMAQ